MNDLITETREFLTNLNKSEFKPQDLIDKLKNSGATNNEIRNYLTSKTYMASLSLKQQQFLIQAIHLIKDDD